MTDEVEFWRRDLEQLAFSIAVFKDALGASPSGRVAERSTKMGLSEGPLRELLAEHEASAIRSPELKGIVDPLIAAAIALLYTAIPTTELFKDELERLSAVNQRALDALDSIGGSEDVIQVVDEFETRYLVTLASTLSAHRTLADQLEARSEADGKFFDVGMYDFVDEPGPGRVSIADLDRAMDSGVTTIIPGRGLVAFERLPPIQVMIYGQWFAYMHSIWDEWYRPRLAEAHSRETGGEFLKNDIKSEFMRDLNRIRNDVVHNKARAKESAKNSILSWTTEDGRVGMTTERMLGLLMKFPRADLLLTPERGEPPASRNLPWTAGVEQIDSVMKRMDELGLSKRDQKNIGNEMLQLWLSANADNAGPS